MTNHAFIDIGAAAVFRPVSEDSGSDQEVPPA